MGLDADLIAVTDSGEVEIYSWRKSQEVHDALYPDYDKHTQFIPNNLTVSDLAEISGILARGGLAGPFERARKMLIDGDAVSIKYTEI